MRKEEEELFEGKHDSKLAAVKLLRRKRAIELGKRETNEPGSLLWRVFIQRPLVFYQLNGLGTASAQSSWCPSFLC